MQAIEEVSKSVIPALITQSPVALAKGGIGLSGVEPEEGIFDPTGLTPAVPQTDIALAPVPSVDESQSISSEGFDLGTAETGFPGDPGGLGFPSGDDGGGGGK